MDLKLRTSLMCCLFVPSIAFQQLVQLHLNDAAPARQLVLSVPLEEFPQTIKGWAGHDVPIVDPEFLYGDEHLNRLFVAPDLSSTATLWIGFSSQGADRNHNPEVCMQAHGFVERRESRTMLNVEDGGKPIRKYRFMKPDGSDDCWVFYWHYSVDPVDPDQHSLLQRTHLKHTPRASMTVEVFAPAGRAPVDDFVRAAERQIRRRINSNAIRSSNIRLVYLVNDGGVVPE